MRIIFDLNGTVFGAIDCSLRPGIRETIDALREKGYTVDFWTSGSIERYQYLLKETGIEGRVYTKVKDLPFKPDICVDDEPQDWMPGRVFKVKTHLSDELPGNLILDSDLLFGEDENFFYWD